MRPRLTLGLSHFWTSRKARTMWLMIALAIAYGACLVAYLVAALKVARILDRVSKLDLPDASSDAPFLYGTTRHL